MKKENMGISVSPTRSLQERVAAFLRNMRKERRYVITPQDSRPEMARRCGERLRLPDDAMQQAVFALDAFKDEMLAIKDVEAVAFLAARAPNCPTTLTVEVLTRLEFEDERATQAVMNVEKAKAALSEWLASVLPSGLRFVNTARMNVDSLEPHLRDKWSKDSTLELLAFVVFQRDSSTSTNAS